MDLLKKIEQILSDEMILDIGLKKLENIIKIVISVNQYFGMDQQDILKNPNFSYGSIPNSKKIIENNKVSKIFQLLVVVWFL